jgi:hypothetical protein
VGRDCFIIAFLAGMVLGCGPKSTPLPPSFDPTAGPVIPAMFAPVYATGHGLPKDPLTAQVALGHKWSESLSGAAAAVGLEVQSDATLQAAQHAAHRAGYPYPVRSISIGWVPAGDYPDELADGISRILRQGDDLGLARVRTLGKDRWVALIAHPTERLEPIRRERRKGTEVAIRTTSLCRWVLVSPSGTMHTGTTPDTAMLDEQGEWWLQVRSLNALVASVPLYVDLATPPAPVIDLPGDSVIGPGDAIDLALELMGDIRQAFGVSGFLTDATLQTLAHYPLKQVLDDSWTLVGGVNRLRGAGFIGGPVTQVHCSAPTVATCLDAMLQEPVNRSALLNQSYRLVGTAAQVRTDGVTLLFNLASQ